MINERPPFRVELYRSREKRAGQRVKITGEMRLDHLPAREVAVWRWRKVAANGRIIATSGEGYHNREDCLHGLLLATPRYYLAMTGDALKSKLRLPDHPAYAIEVREIPC